MNPDMMNKVAQELIDKAPTAEEDRLIRAITELQTSVYNWAIGKGWWEGNRNDAELICLMHSELSEALDALRHGNPPDDHIPQFSGTEAELADVIIRIADYAQARNLRLGEAIVAKMRYNHTRPYRHGGKQM